jgi:hypothetical protein
MAIITKRSVLSRKASHLSPSGFGARFRLWNNRPIYTGPMLWFLKIFSPKHLAKILAFFAQTTASCCKNLIITSVFEKNDIFCWKLAKMAENCHNNIYPLVHNGGVIFLTQIFEFFDAFWCIDVSVNPRKKCPICKLKDFSTMTTNIHIDGMRESYVRTSFLFLRPLQITRWSYTATRLSQTSKICPAAII